MKQQVANKEIINRIKQMESYFNILQKAVSKDKDAIEKDDVLKEYMQVLIHYYESTEWKNDYKFDEKGFLPADLKRGILSEDGFWNFLCEVEGKHSDIEHKNMDDIMNFDAFVSDIKKNDWNVFGVEVYKRGHLIHSYGDTTTTRYPIYSATKTITSIAVGLAVDEGKIDINKSILDYLPVDVIVQMGETQVKTYKDITIKRLLTMSVSGYPFRPEGENWLTASLNYTIPDANKLEFSYSNVSAYLVGVAVSHAVGEDLYQYLHRKLFEPLGIIKPPYETCPDGYFYGASKMELTVHELSKIGLLLYHGGCYEDKRILSQEYVKEATSVQQMNREGGYGYFIWKYRDGFSINGKWKQKCYILPQEELVITYLAHIEDDTPDLKESMEKHILGIQ